MARRVTYTSRIPEILDRVERDVPEVNKDTANQIATQARATVAVFRSILKREVRVTRGNHMTFRVEVGKARGRGFYAHMVEFGTVRMSAQPFLVPAAEAQRAVHRRRLAELYE